jgi:hypothetical protein
MGHMDSTATVFRWFVMTFLSLLFLALFPYVIRRDVNICHPMKYNSNTVRCCLGSQQTVLLKRGDMGSIQNQ